MLCSLHFVRWMVCSKVGRIGVLTVHVIIVLCDFALWKLATLAVHMGHCVLWVMRFEEISFANCVHRQVSALSMAWLACHGQGHLSKPIIHKLTQTQRLFQKQNLPDFCHSALMLNFDWINDTMTWHAKCCWWYFHVPCSYDLHLLLQIQRYKRGNRHLQRVGGGSIKPDKNLIMDPDLFVDQRRSLSKGSL